MERLEYHLGSDHKWSDLKLIPEPVFPVVVLLNDGYGEHVTTDAATNVKPTTVTINGTLDNDGGTPCDCGFEYGLTTSYGTTTPTESKTTGQTFSQNISGLIPNRTYHFRAVASIGHPYASHGYDKTFTTLTHAHRHHPTIPNEPTIGRILSGMGSSK